MCSTISDLTTNKITIFYFVLLYNYKKGICILIQYEDRC